MGIPRQEMKDATRFFYSEKPEQPFLAFLAVRYSPAADAMIIRHHAYDCDPANWVSIGSASLTVVTRSGLVPSNITPAAKKAEDHCDWYGNPNEYSKRSKAFAANELRTRVPELSHLSDDFPVEWSYNGGGERFVSEGKSNYFWDKTTGDLLSFAIYTECNKATGEFTYLGHLFNKSSF